MSLPYKIENGVASLVVNKKRKLTERQLANLKRTEHVYGVESAQRYISSLLGLTKRPVDVSRPKIRQYNHDRLASKPPGSILSKFKSLLYCEEDASHRPSSRSVGQWIGVEIECLYPAIGVENDDGEYEPNISQEEAHRELRKAIQHANIPRVSVKDDGSVHDSDGDGVGVEVTILFNTEDGFGPLQKLCDVLNRKGCFVNNTCGLHVHLDARHLQEKGVKRIGRRLGNALPVLKWIVDPSRHTNNYCALAVSEFRDSRDYRYNAINLTSWFEFKTVEVRLHGGSTNFKKIKNWIELLRFLASTRVPRNFSTFQHLIELGTPEHLIEYADKRITRLNPTAWAKLMPPAPDAPPTDAQAERMRELVRDGHIAEPGE